MKKYKKILYFGLDPSGYPEKSRVVHLPLIRIKPFAYEKIKPYLETFHTHVLFTSKVAVTLFFSHVKNREKSYICLGKATADRLAELGVKADWIAKRPCAEGVKELLDTLEYKHLLYPHSAKSRPLLLDYLKGKGTSFALYDTLLNKVTLPPLDHFDTLVFTSPTTVDAFAKLCFRLPSREKCETIGSVTEQALNKLFESNLKK